MKKVCLVALVLSLACCAFAQDAATAPHHVTKIYRPGFVPPQSGTIFYGGGPVMNGATNVYVIYYGNWPTKSRNIINGYLQHLGGSHYYKVNTTFTDTTGGRVQNVVNYNPTTNSYNDNYTMGKNLTDAQLQTVISNAIAGGHLPNDQTNGVYFVLTAQDVSESASFGTFCGTYCGYHSPSNSIVAGETIKYSFVGNPAQCPTGCDGNVALYGDKTTPNGDVGGDGTISIMFHELSESVTDPNVTFANGAWGDNVTQENGDVCNFFFGPTKLATNGSHYNETIIKTKYLIQQMAKVSPPSPVTVGNYTGTCVGYMK
jgi:hypothetical protein